MAKPKLKSLLTEIRACQVCAEHLPHGTRPVLRAHTNARLLIVGQAPGRRVHETGIPWNDPSGDTLREWLQMTRDEFYDERNIAIIPAGFCYPGTGKNGDLPPRPECAPLWHPPLLAALPKIELTLLIGSYAQAYYLRERIKKTLTETVANYAEYLPGFLPLPHPSPRNRLWLKRNSWFAEEVLPILRRQLKKVFRD
ncbi:MAG: uracil-DNA glycosylase family protein [Blastocatellia bacterium]